MDKQIQLRVGEVGSEKKKAEFVPKEVWEKQKEEERCMKGRRSNEQAEDCKASLQAKTLFYFSNANKKPVQKKRKFNRGLLNIKERSSAEDLVHK